MSRHEFIVTAAALVWLVTVLPSAISAQELSTQATGFSDATSGPLGDEGPGGGVAWIDFDNDGDFDIYLANAGWPVGAHREPYSNRLFRNDGGGVFVDVTTAPLDHPGPTLGVAFGDTDNDGDCDLYLADVDEHNTFLRNDAALGFADATVSPLEFPWTRPDDVYGLTAAFGDTDNDGDLDLYVGNIGQNRLFRNEGDGTWTEATRGPLADDGSVRGVVMGDMDGDGDLDIVISNNGSIVLLSNEGEGDFTRQPIQNGGLNRGVDLGDVDNDGFLDVFVAVEGGPCKIFYNRGDGRFGVGALPSASTSALGLGLADLDNDGDLDVVLCDGRSVRLFLGDGRGHWAEVPEQLPAGIDAVTMAFADMDNDGDIDIYTSSGKWHKNRLLRNDRLAAGNHWLHVRAVGSLSNRSAIGAHVRIVAGNKRQVREVVGATGYLSQGSLPVEFGLGPTSTVDSLIVRWPSGQVQVLTGIVGDQLVTVLEPSPNRPPECGAAISGVPANWPPSHDFVPVSITGVDDPDGDVVAISATSITQDEVVSRGSGEDGCGDGRIDETGTAWIRLDRLGSGNGRVYSIGFTATDPQGLSCNGAVTVCVPHDQGQGQTCMDDGQRYNSIVCGRGDLAAASVATDAQSPPATLMLSTRTSGRTVTFDYGIPTASPIDLALFDVAGRRVATIVHEQVEAASRSATWNARGLPQGLYFARLRSDADMRTRTILLIE